MANEWYNYGSSRGADQNFNYGGTQAWPEYNENLFHLLSL